MEPFVGQICLFGFNFAPKGWAMCQGQLLPISQNQALFALIGTTYGGDGQTNFALPDLRGRAPVGFGQGLGLNSIALGEKAGNQSTTLNANQMPQHNHLVSATVTLAASTTTTSANPSGLLPATLVEAGGADVQGYGSVSNATLAANAASAAVTCFPAGGGQPVGILNPYLGLNWCIATDGVFPPRN